MSLFPPIVIVELGTAKIRVLVAEIREDGHLMVTGIGEQPSRGVRKGEVIHFDNALSFLRSALEEAEAQSRIVINEVYTLLSGGAIQGLINRGSVPVMEADHEIGEETIEHVLETAKAVSLPPDRDIVHTIQQHFYVDDQHSVVDPEGMEGSKLSVDMLVLHGVRSRMRNTLRVVKSAHVEVVDAAFSGLCAGLAVLDSEQKEMGALVIDLGGGTTDYVVYAEKTVAFAGSIAIGGDHVTNDLAIGLGIPAKQAEQLKREHGSAMIDLSMRERTVSLPAEGGFPGRTVKSVDLQTIIHARMLELFNMIKQQLLQQEILHLIRGGVILTGGGAHLKRMTELAEKIFEWPSFLGKAKNISGLAVVTEGREYAAPVGMLRFAARTLGRKDGGAFPLTSFLKSLFGK